MSAWRRRLVSNGPCLAGRPRRTWSGTPQPGGPTPIAVLGFITEHLVSRHNDRWIATADLAGGV